MPQLILYSIFSITFKIELFYPILPNKVKTNLRIVLKVSLVFEVHQAVQFPLGITKSLSAFKSLTSKCHWRSITMNV